jgi:hypothetical protein
MSGIPNIGIVYDYERWTADWSAFIALFKNPTTGKILGWEISRSGFSEDATSVKPHSYVIQGYMQVNDAGQSEKTFNSHIDVIAAAFRADKRLKLPALGHEFIQAETIDTRMFGGVLCHYTRLAITVQEHNQ